MKPTTLPRQFTPYEKNQLRRHGVDEEVARRYGQMPVEYITGHVEFCGLDFLIDQRALIPRVETEELIEEALSEFAKQTNVSRTIKILEVGTGSGAVAISLAHQLEKTNQDYHITATDIDKKALELTQKNLKHISKKSKISNLKSKINLVHSDLFDNVSKEKFNIMIANLPYIPTVRIKVLEASVKDYEPHIALDGGEDGLELISKFLNQASQYLSDDGVILLEIDYTHPEILRQRFNHHYHIKTWISKISRCTFARLTPKKL